MENIKKLKIYLGILYVLLISTFLYFFFSKFTIQELSSYEFIKNNVDYFSNLKDKNYYTLLLTFFLFVVFWVLLLGFGSPVALASGFIFGKWIGTIIIATSLSVGSLLLYLIANFFFRDLVQQKLGNKMVFLKDLFKKNEFLYFLVYRFIGGLPFFIHNTLPVIFNIKIINYFFGTLLGMIPQLFIMVSIGSGLEKIIKTNNSPPSFFEIIASKDIYLPLIAFIAIVVISIFLKKKFYK
ncbi:VTT domain-containing protein [Candidatus Pelagibacter sp.]|nr:VTT domain-containing protein [Candidatus Pelagibacter sp.]